MDNMKDKISQYSLTMLSILSPASFNILGWILGVFNSKLKL